MRLKKALFLLFLVSQFHVDAHAQGYPNYEGGYIFTSKKDSTTFFRLLSWAQMQTRYSNIDGKESTDLLLRRARLLLYAQLTERFVIVTHFGLNNLGSSTMSPLGTGEGSQLFFHDAYVQYGVGKNHAIGGGLHYFNGISRLNNQSTLNLLTLDNNRSSWATMGLSDQFARHIGAFGKGEIGKLTYQVAINDAITQTLDNRSRTQFNQEVTYEGKKYLGQKAAFAYAGYFEFAFLDQEARALPYRVGTYLGEKDIFNLGAGFFLHPNGSVAPPNGTTTEYKGENVNIFALDAFLDKKIGAKNAAITAYGVLQINDYGTNYLYGPYGTGNMVYGHIGYLIASDAAKTRFQPYVSYKLHDFAVTEKKASRFGCGINAYFKGHHSKLTLEYAYGDSPITISQSVIVQTVTLQAQIYL
jgi:hypothetical protein